MLLEIADHISELRNDFQTNVVRKLEINYQEELKRILAIRNDETSFDKLKKLTTKHSILLKDFDKKQLSSQREISRVQNEVDKDQEQLTLSKQKEEALVSETLKLAEKLRRLELEINSKDVNLRLKRKRITNKLEEFEQFFGFSIDFQKIEGESYFLLTYPDKVLSFKMVDVSEEEPVYCFSARRSKFGEDFNVTSLENLKDITLKDVIRLGNSLREERQAESLESY